jgi:site-specific recombinase XerD
VRLTPEDTLDAASFRAWLDLKRDLDAVPVSPRTIEGYEYSLARAGRALGGDLLGATRGDLTAYLTAGHAAGLRHGTVHKWWRDLRRFYRFCVAEDIIGASPMRRVPEPKGDEQAPPIVTDADLARLLAACAGKGHDELRDTAVILLWCETGSPRATEAATLLAADVDLRNSQVKIHGKGGRWHWVALSADTARAFSRYERARGRRPGAGLWPQFFLGLKGPMTRSGLRQILNRRCAQARIPRIHPHQLRHTATVRSRLAGIPDVAIAHLNGWNSTRMMERYGRWAAATESLAHSRRASIATGLVNPKAAR